MAPSRPLPDEPLGIALLNSVWNSSNGRVDLFATVDGLRAWIDDLGLEASATEASRIALLSAREAVRAHADSPESGSSRAALNEILQWGHSRPVLEADGVGVEQTTPDPAHRAAWLAVVDYAGLVAAGPYRIRACAHPDCILYFYDSSARGKRRWCSMAACGNRAKAARHYARGKSDGASP